MELNYDLLDERLDRLEKVLADLERRDDDIYRAIYESEPIPDDIRQAGYGGVNRYKKLDGFRYSEMVKLITQRVDKVSKQMVVQSKSYDEIWELIGNKDKMLASIPAIMPVNKKDLKITTSGFGYRVDPIYKTIKFHAGMDFVTDQGKPIYATGDGRVEFAGRDDSGYGIHVIINHGFGYKTLYGHMIELKCKQGQKVKRGDLIGLVGSTGKSVGPHLHYEVRKNNEPINPVNFYFNDLTADEYQKIIKESNQEGGQALD